MGNRSTVPTREVSRCNSVYDLFQSVYWNPDIAVAIRNAIYGPPVEAVRDEDTITVDSDTLTPEDYIIKDAPMHDLPQIIVVPMVPAVTHHLHKGHQRVAQQPEKYAKSI